MAALDALNSLATTLEGIPGQITASNAAAVATAEEALEAPIASIQTAVTAILAVLPAPVVADPMTTTETTMAS